MWGLAIVAIVAVIGAGVWVVLARNGSAGVGISPTSGNIGSRVSAAQQTMDLARQGVIPKQAVNWDDVELRSLIDRGIVPAGNTAAGSALDAEQQATIDLANQGVIPRQSVNWDDVELRQLVDQGVLPLQALP